MGATVNEGDERKDRIARRRALGAELRRVFGRVTEEPVPDALRKLAKRLDEQLPPAEAPDANGDLKDGGAG